MTDLHIEYLHAVLSPAGLDLLEGDRLHREESVLFSLVSDYDAVPVPDVDGYRRFDGMRLFADVNDDFPRWFWRYAAPRFEPGVRIIDHLDDRSLNVVVDGKVVTHSALIVYPTFETFGDIIEKVQAAQ